MYFGRAPTYFSCIMRAFPFRGWDFYSEAMKELWPGCRSPWIVWNCLFCCHSQACVPLHLMHFQKMVFQLCAYLDSRMKYMFTIENSNSWPQKVHPLPQVWGEGWQNMYWKLQILWFLSKHLLWENQKNQICSGKIPIPFY